MSTELMLSIKISTKYDFQNKNSWDLKLVSAWLHRRQIVESDK